ncbi:hypothetical protein UFOVP185_14 [uncultured Caudovirales phage]|uniref:Uncharacterized protein n=1 Tax=uncultured Caudovirales phage TaxID=2100421 RepID=A0A6J7WGQ5_9CAUD|nr:hypothetical protein UFOVP185_14 [uncultured Caudovirales phage]
MDKQEWMEQIEEEFNRQTSEQVKYLLNKCEYEFTKDDRVMAIVNTIRKNNNISFNQWKALKAQLYKHTKDNKPVKKLSL